MNVSFLCAEDFHTMYPEQFVPIYNGILRGRYDVNFLWVFRTTREESISETSWDNSKVILVPKPDFRSGLLKSYITYFKNLRAVMRLVDNCYRADVIHAFDEPLMGLVAYWASRKQKVPLVYQVTHLKEEETVLWGRYNVYGSPLKNVVRGKVGLIIRNWVLRRADMVFAVSDQMKELFIGYGVKADKIKVVQAGVNCGISVQDYKFAAKGIRESFGLEGNRVLFYMGTLSRFRKLDFMLDVLKQVSDKYDNVKLMVVSGNNDDKVWFKNEAEKRSVGEKIIMVDTVPRKDLYGYIEAADVCLAPYEPNLVHNCNSPVKLLEYLVMGKVIVGTNIPSQKDIIDKLDAGYCVDHTVNAYSDAICKVFQNAKEIRSLDIERIQSYLRSQRSFEAIAEKVFDGYRCLLIQAV